jgi:hypothetical protein
VKNTKPVFGSGRTASPSKNLKEAWQEVKERVVIVHPSEAANPWEVLGRPAALKKVISMDVKE